jgi:serine/threonine protein kinase/DNA polymerase III delta prime subunit
MAQIFRASDLQKDGRIVAVKMFRPEVLADPLALEAFRRETEAIRSCEHPNIIELFDVGIDQETGRHFLVLEWMAESLEEFLAREIYRDWDEFFGKLGRALLEALALAHNRQIIHRDLKPSNVLFTDCAVPKLADFSIAKLKRWRDEGLTLSNFASRPYAPPDHDSESSYSRDLFSFAVLAVRCLSSASLKEYEDVSRALETVPIPKNVKDLLNTCLGEPDERPVVAGLLLSSLDAIQRERGRRDRLRVPVYLVLSGRARERVTTELGLDARSKADDAVVLDLQEMPALSRASDKSMELYGGRCIYRVSLPRSARDYLLVEDARKVSTDFLEKRRQRALPLHCEFKQGKPVRSQEAATSLETLVDNLEQHEAEQRQFETTARENQLFDSWITTLRAKADLEKEKQPSLRFTSAKIDEGHAVFTVVEIPRDDVLGQPREVRSGHKLHAIGEIESINGNEVTFSIRTSYSSTIPKVGELAVDMTLARIALDRQWSALDSIRYQRCVRPNLRDLLVFPAETRTPAQLGRKLTFFQDNLARDKQVAIESALGAPDFLLVEGPPGTGKTTFITELILQLLAESPRSRLLLTAQTHVALDHVLGALQKIGTDVDAIRIGRLRDPRISAIGGELLFEKRLEQWRELALASGKKFLQRLADGVGVPMAHVEEVMTVRRFISARSRAQALENRLKQLEDSLGSIAEVSPVNAEERRAISDNARLLRDQIDHEEGEHEAARRSVTELTQLISSRQSIGKDPGAMSDAELEKAVAALVPEKTEFQVLLRMARLHADWQAQCGRTPDFQAAVLSSVQLVAGTCVGIDSSRGTREVDFDVCIVDEASKAAPTELLVPLAKAKRWILVGDDRQLPPFVDRALTRPEVLTKYDLTKEQLNETLFSRMKASLPDQCHVELRTQHRMVPAIGNLISNCFYDGHLSSEERVWDSTLSGILGKPVVWLTTARKANRGELAAAASSCLNRLEVRIISELLEKLEASAAVANRDYSVGVLAPYGAQKQALERAMATRMDSAGRLRIECNTVDAFQGREVDIAVFSVTRSNTKRRLGFLDEFRRLNVALSRAREYLVIVGDHQFCLTAADPNPFRPVLAHIRANPKECVMSEL